MTWTDVWEAGRGLYSIALVVALLRLARLVPVGLRVLTGLSDAMTLAANALLASTTSAESQARMEAKINQIHAAVCRPEGSPPP